jgi:hypothetical protein
MPGFGTKTVTNEDGKVVKITATCKLCTRKSQEKEFKVLSEPKPGAEREGRYRTSASWSGPKRHLERVHSIHTIEAL